MNADVRILSDTKRCTRCNKVQDRDQFFAMAKSRDGKHPYCRTCTAAYQRDRARRKRDMANGPMAGTQS